MAKKLICFGCASVGLLMLSACGSTNNVPVNQSDVWHGGGNAVQTDGYWFSYTDHVQWMKDNTGWDPNTHTPSQGASIAPLTNLTVSMPMATDPTAPEHGDVIQVIGFTPEAPAWADVIRSDPNPAAGHEGGWFDTYYQQTSPTLEYPDSLVTAYPVAGVGFGFKHDNAQYDPSHDGLYVGVAFDMKTQGNTVSVNAQLAEVCSATNGDDLADPYYSDAFPAPGCTYSKMTTIGEDLATQGSDYNTEQTHNTCFAYMHKWFKTLPDNKWQTYCILWNELTLPTEWLSPTATPPTWNDDTLKNCTTKLKWEMDKLAAPGTTSKFNVMLDNIKLITRAQASDAAYNCNVSALPTDTTKLIGPAASADGG